MSMHEIMHWAKKYQMYIYIYINRQLDTRR